MRNFRTSEHVSPGHPDKICDQISELSLFQTKQWKGNETHYACDSLIKNDKVVMSGEGPDLSSREILAMDDFIKGYLRDNGYGREYLEEFNMKDWTVLREFTVQSPDINRGVSQKRIGAGDIGIMYGGATNESPDCTFLPHYIARQILMRVYDKWRTGAEIFLRPDMKCLVTVEYDNDKPVAVKEITLCISHDSKMSDLEVKEKAHVFMYTSILPEIASELINIDFEKVELRVNPTGRFAIYGPVADSGLTGRKIVCDQYGGGFAVGGGNLNGKDATKVDRSGVYAARYLAKNIVVKGWAKKCEVQIAYSIGVPDPVSIYVNCFGTEKLSKKATIRNFVSSIDNSVDAIINRFGLNNMHYEIHKRVSSWGHIGNIGPKIILPWERVDID